MPLVLASSSPRRRALLEAAGVRHRVVAVAVDETPEPGLSPREVAEDLARRKARAAAARLPDATILAADTVVSLDGEVIGKPGDEAAARETLRRLSGREHEVVTAFCLRMPGSDPRIRSVTSRVRFRTLTEEEIEAYVRSGEPLDKAGAYAIQGGGGAFVAALVGSRDNVIGLPVREILESLREAT